MKRVRHWISSYPSFVKNKLCPVGSLDGVPRASCESAMNPCSSARSNSTNTYFPVSLKALFSPFLVGRGGDVSFAVEMPNADPPIVVFSQVPQLETQRHDQFLDQTPGSLRRVVPTFSFPEYLRRRTADIAVLLSLLERQGESRSFFYHHLSCPPSSGSVFFWWQSTFPPRFHSA